MRGSAGEESSGPGQRTAQGEWPGASERKGEMREDPGPSSLLVSSEEMACGPGRGIRAPLQACRSQSHPHRTASSISKPSPSQSEGGFGSRIVSTRKDRPGLCNHHATAIAPKPRPHSSDAMNTW